MSRRRPSSSAEGAGDAQDDIIERSPDGRYVRFNTQLGHGAFKEVFKGYDEEEGNEIAWCQVVMDRVSESEKRAIAQEVELLKNVQHKHILAFIDCFELESPSKPIVFITEYMSSGTLKQYINKAKRVKRKVIKKWCRQMLDGLAFLHKSRIIHRDLKCENIFINGNNAEIKIGDLGLSTMMKDGEQQAQSVLGTPEFMALICTTSSTTRRSTSTPSACASSRWSPASTRTPSARTPRRSIARSRRSPSLRRSIRSSTPTRAASSRSASSTTTACARQIGRAHV